MVVLSPTLSLLTFCLQGLSGADRGLLKLPTTVANSSSSLAVLSVFVSHILKLYSEAHTH